MVDSIVPKCAISSINITFEVGDIRHPHTAYFHVCVAFAECCGIDKDPIALIDFPHFVDQSGKPGDLLPNWEDQLAMEVTEQIYNTVQGFSLEDLEDMVCAVSTWDGEDKASADALKFAQTYVVFTHDDYGLDIRTLALYPNAKVQYRYHWDSPDQWSDTTLLTKDIDWGNKAIESVRSWLQCQGK